MKFTKGLIIGSIITAGAIMMYTDNMNGKKMIKKGKQVIKKVGII